MPEPTKPLNWKRSSHCAASSCIEVAINPAGVHVRDSESPDGPHLTFTANAWRAFLADVRANRYDNT